MRAQPFTFDREFDRDGPRKAPATNGRRPAMPEDAEALRARAFAEGEASAVAAAARRTADGIQCLSERLAALSAQLDDTLKIMRMESVGLSYLIAQKLSHALVASRPAAEIEALIGRCLDEQRAEPNIVIRINDTLHDTVKDIVTRLTEEKRFPGRVVVIGEPQIEAGDCTIEWSGGGLERDTRAVAASIDQVVRTYFHAQGMDNAAALMDAIASDRNDSGSEEGIQE